MVHDCFLHNEVETIKEEVKITSNYSGKFLEQIKVFKDEVIPHCLKNGYKLGVVDNDSKFHKKILVQAAAEEGIQNYPESGKRCWVKREV